MLSRRRFLVGGAVALSGAAAVGIATEALPGRPWALRQLGLTGDDGAVPDIAAGPRVGGVLDSAARGVRTSWTVAYPPGHDPATGGLRTLVVLHGKGGTHTAAFDDGLRLDRYLAAAVEGGTPPFAIASVDGGDTYWHARASGEDSGAMVLDELVPLLTDQGLRTDRVGLLGWSMGGYGALRLGPLLAARGQAGPVVAESPALWRRWEDAAPGAFDDAEDFSAHTVVGRQHELDGLAVRIDCGTADPFEPVARDYVDGLTGRPAGGFEPGDHSTGYWRRMAPAQLAFVGARLGGS